MAKRFTISKSDDITCKLYSLDGTYISGLIDKNFKSINDVVISLINRTNRDIIPDVYEIHIINNTKEITKYLKFKK